MSASNEVQSLDQLRAKAAATVANVKTEIGNAAADVKDTASEVRSSVAGDLQSLLQSARQSGQAELTAAADRIGHQVEIIAEAASAFGKRGKETAMAAMDTTDTYVKANPWQSVAIGTGVGALIGFAIGCMTMRR